MYRVRFLATALVALLVSGCNGKQQPSGNSSAYPFDFYVLSLSWSPTYCATEGNGNQQQCGSDKRYGFIVHGLWPQFEKGYPKDCPTEFGPEVPRDLVRSMTDIMPSNGLIRHQWRKHGSCTGLSQQQYFQVTREAFETVRIPDAIAGGKRDLSIAPDDVEKAFATANPGLQAEGIAVTCDGAFIDEVRICLAHDLTFRSCAEVDADACRSSRKTLPGIARPRQP